MIKKLDESVFDALLEAGVEDDAVDMVLAALAGEAALDAVLAGEAAPPRPDAKTARVAPHGAFLSRLTVRGFRGIGRPTVVNLPSGPGLTVIAGRNGSGSAELPADALLRRPRPAVDGETERVARLDRPGAGP